MNKRQATRGQFDFIKTLQEEREVPQNLIHSMRKLWYMGEFTEDVASGYIQAMLAMPEIKNAINANMNLLGYHRFNDDVYKVYRSNFGMMYVKKMSVREDGRIIMMSVPTSILKNLHKNTKMGDKASQAMDTHLRNNNAIR